MQSISSFRLCWDLVTALSAKLIPVDQPLALLAVFIALLMAFLLNHLQCKLFLRPSWQPGKQQLINSTSGEETTVDLACHLKFNEAGWARVVHPSVPSVPKSWCDA